MGEEKFLSVHRPTSNKSLVTYSLKLTIASPVSRLAIDICACSASHSDATKIAIVKFSENRENVQCHEAFCGHKAVRKQQRRAPAMFSPPSEQTVNGNLIVKDPHFVCVSASIDVREDENRASRIFPVHVDTYVNEVHGFMSDLPSSPTSGHGPGSSIILIFYSHKSFANVCNSSPGNCAPKDYGSQLCTHVS